MDRHEFEKVYRLVQDEREHVEETNNRSWYVQYLYWVEAVSAYQLKKSGYEDTIVSLKQLLSDEYALINEKDFLAMKIMNAIAFIHAEHQQYTESLLYYNKSLKRDFDRENKSPLQLPRIYRLRILYNKAKTLYEIEDYEKAVEELNAGILASREEHNMSLLGNFYYYLGQCYEKLSKDRATISEAYKSAEQIFVFLEKKVYLDILYTHKKEYL
nr:hypothetical protein [Jeotgalibacillus terrae]